ncbi:MAG: hypothetical protein M3Y08_17940, partial [Fibrobacterota bacterium]|nr:hypothetical protein [Fibrobacterota bacterium]
VPPPIVRLRFLPASQGFFSEEVDASGQPAFIAARSDGARWQVFAGATREGTISACGTLGCGDGNLGLSHPSVEVEADGPFSFETRVFSNLGILVAHWKGRIEGPFLTDNIKNPATGTYTLRLGWNGRGNDGERAGTGAYIWKVRVKSLVQPGMGQAGSFLLGYLRRTGN